MLFFYQASAAWQETAGRLFEPVMDKSRITPNSVDTEYMLQHSPAVSYVCKAYDDFGALFITGNIREQTGYSPEDFTGNSSFWLDHIHPDDRQHVLKDLGKVFEEGHHSHEYRFLHADGHYLWMRDELRLVLNEEGAPFQLIGYWVDISSRKEAEEDLKKVNATLQKTISQQGDMLQAKIDELRKTEYQLMKAQKMDALGRITGGVAHDFNNMLAVIKGYSELIMEVYAPGDESGNMVTYLENVIQTSNRAHELVQQMLSYSHGEPGNPGVVYPEVSVREVISFLRSVVPSSIEIEIIGSDDHPRVFVDAVQLRQVIMNLVLNARDAIPDEKGRITIQVSQESGISSDCHSCHREFSGDYVVVSVADSGEGIQGDSDIVSRIFDPFFSTKEFGKGTGMGLSVVHGIVHGSGGHIQVRPVDGGGTRFSIYLPVTTRAEKHDADTPASLPAVHGSGKILVVDDESTITFFMEEFLSLHGYQVTAFNDSVRALDCFLKDPSAYDLLITDQTMPGMTGLELAQKVMDARLGFPVMLCTGYSDVVDRDIAADAGIKAYLTKPLDTGVFLESIREIMS